MRKHVAAVAATSILVVAGCTTTTVTTDWDHTVDFSSYSSFRVLKSKGPEVPFVDKRIRDSVAAELEAKGFRETDTGASFLVAIHVKSKIHRRVNVNHYGYGYHWNGWGHVGGRSVSVEHIPEGTIVVDIVDASTRYLEWRAVANQELTGNPQKDRTKIDKAIARMFYDFPPGS